MLAFQFVINFKLAAELDGIVEVFVAAAVGVKPDAQAGGEVPVFFKIPIIEQADAGPD